MCGIIGIISPENLQTRMPPDGQASLSSAFECYRGLLVLQHRGQDAAGIVSYDNRTHMFASEKEHGLVAQIFDKKRLENSLAIWQ